MSSPLPDRRWTIGDLDAMPEDGYRHELQAGLLVSEPLPGFRHGRVTAVIAELLGAHVRRNRLGTVVVADTGFVLARAPDTLRGPDVAFVSRERAAKQSDDAVAFEGAPDLAVEVLSPSNSAAEIHAKVADYFAAGCPFVWVVDPAARALTVYESLLAPRVLGEGDVVDGGDVVPGFRVLVGEFFDE